jgi:two-component system phosphate regulon response regulator PhoB
MTADEFDTLYLLVSNPEKVFTRRQIIDLVKGGDYPANDRIVDIRMMKIRRKLNEWAEHLHTVRGVGYKITGF